MFSARQRAIILQRRTQRRKKKRTVRAPRFPKRTELQYTYDLRKLSRDVSALIERAIYPWLETLTPENGVHLDAAIPGSLYKVLEGLKIQTGEMVQPRARALAKKMVESAEAENRANMNEAYKAVVGIDLFPKNPGLKSLMDQRVQANVNLIVTIPGQQIAQVEQVIRSGIESGTRVENIKRDIQERFDVSESRASLIARDQVGKYNAELTETRNRDLGVEEYTWSTSGDERVRDMHKELEGQVFRYDDPPVTNEEGDTNNPGEDYQCRCNAIPNINGVLENLGI